MNFFKLLIVAAFFTSCIPQKEEFTIEQWDVFEIELSGPSAGSPYMEVDLMAEFTINGTSRTVPGFYDGSGTYLIRFSPDKPGTWTYQTTSNVDELFYQIHYIDLSTIFPCSLDFPLLQWIASVGQYRRGYQSASFYIHIHKVVYSMQNPWDTSFERHREWQLLF